MSALAENSLMAKRATTPTKYKDDFLARMKMLRRKRGFKSYKEAGAAFGIPWETYAKYETRSLLPLHLVPKACEVFKCGPWFLITGEDDDVRQVSSQHPGDRRRAARPDRHMVHDVGISDEDKKAS